MTDFEVFALDHARHTHCKGCGGCLLDPSHIVQGYASWCVGCRDRIKRSSPKGAPLPWAGGWEFVGVGNDKGWEDEVSAHQSGTVSEAL